MNPFSTVKRLAIPLLLGLALIGCSNLPRRRPGAPNETAWHRREAALQALRSWRLTAEVGIATEENGGSGSVDWRVAGDKVKFRFTGPFGFGGVRISGNGRRWLVQSSGGQAFTTTNPARALGRQLGLPLPLESLRFWIVGVQDPSAPFGKRRIDNRGRLVFLEQEGWRVDYLDYGRYGRFELPTRLRATRGDVRIKVAVNDWFLGSARSVGLAQRKCLNIDEVNARLILGTTITAFAGVRPCAQLDF